MHVLSYLMFNGRCEEALEFYKQAIGAEIKAMMRFSDNPEPGHCEAGQENKIMHADFSIGDTSLMASDGMCTGSTNFDGINLVIAVNDVEEANKTFNALADGGQVQMPLGETFFAESFGMVQDKFGVTWMIIAEKRRG